jgi:hypothetical protein
MATTPTDVPFTESLWWDELSVSEKVRRLLLLFNHLKPNRLSSSHLTKNIAFPLS